MNIGPDPIFFNLWQRRTLNKCEICSNYNSWELYCDPFFVTTAAAFAPQLPSPILRIPHFSFSPHFPSMHSYSLILESQNPSTHITMAFSFATSLPSLSPSLVLFSFLFPDFISQVTMWRHIVNTLHSWTVNGGYIYFAHHLTNASFHSRSCQRWWHLFWCKNICSFGVSIFWVIWVILKNYLTNYFYKKFWKR